MNPLKASSFSKDSPGAGLVGATRVRASLRTTDVAAIPAHTYFDHHRNLNPSRSCTVVEALCARPLHQGWLRVASPALGASEPMLQIRVLGWMTCVHCSDR